MASGRAHQVSRVYHEALAYPIEERATFLAEACGGDASLRHEVESLLAGVTLIDAPFPTLDHPLTTLPKTVASGAQPGQTLASYRIERLLGRGGMGLQVGPLVLMNEPSRSSA